jgi:hypothetical protein
MLGAANMEQKCSIGMARETEQGAVVAQLSGGTLHRHIWCFSFFPVSKLVW